MEDLGGPVPTMRRASADKAHYVFLPLFGEPQGMESLQALDRALDDQAGGSCRLPPVSGLAFISASGEVGEMLDAWWEEALPADSRPVLLALHEPGLESWVHGLDVELL